MSFSLPSENSWALITGASSGIGEVFAKRFAREGWNTILVARSIDKLKLLAQLLEKEKGIKTLILQEDLTDPKAPKRVHERIQEKGITLEGLINNAGFGVAGKFSEAPLDDYLKMINLNARALVELTGFFLPGMIQRKHGFIINVSSTACFQPLPYSSVYAATKSFVTAFSEALWLETKKTGVRILNLCPGLTKTNFGTAMGSRDFRKDPFAQTPEAVVDYAFRALQRNQPTIISGWHNRLLVLIERLVPHRFLLELVLLYQKTRGRV